MDFSWSIYHGLELYILAESFIFHSDKYLLFELTYYFVYNTPFFCLKIFIIEHVELILVNIVLDKPVLY